MVIELSSSSCKSHSGMMCPIFKNLFPVVRGGFFSPSVSFLSFSLLKHAPPYERVIKRFFSAFYCETTKRSLCIRSLSLSVQFLFLIVVVNQRRKVYYTRKCSFILARIGETLNRGEKKSPTCVHLKKQTLFHDYH